MIESRHFLLNYGFNPVSSNTVQTDDEFNVYPLAWSNSLAKFFNFLDHLLFIHLCAYPGIHSFQGRALVKAAHLFLGHPVADRTQSTGSPRGQEPLLMNKNATEGSWQRQGLPTRCG